MDIFQVYVLDCQIYFCEKLSSESIFSECCYSNSLQDVNKGKSSKVRLTVQKVVFLQNKIATKNLHSNIKGTSLRHILIGESKILFAIKGKDFDMESKVQSYACARVYILGWVGEAQSITFSESLLYPFLIFFMINFVSGNI